MQLMKIESIVLMLIVTAALTVSAQAEPTPVPNAEEPTAEAAAEPAAASEPEEAKVPMIYRERTKIVIDGRAEFNGVLELAVTPHGEDSTKVRLNVLAKSKAKKIADDVFNEIAFALGDRYKVKKSGEKVLVKAKNKKTPPVSINVLNQQLAGVSVMIGNG